MSGERRRRPDDPARRGWCPSIARPMPTGDGLLARVHPPLGILTAAQLRAVAEAARRHGNGHIDITARGNLQIRGVSEATAQALASCLSEAGLADARSDGGPQRLTLTSALAGFDPDERIDVPVLARAIEEVGLTVPGLAAKTLVAIDGGGRWGHGAAEADFFVDGTGPSHVAVGLATEVDVVWCAETDAVDVPVTLGRALKAFVATGGRRVRDLDEVEIDQVAAAVAEPSRASPSPLRGGGWPSRQRGSGEGSAFSGYGASLSRPASRATLSRRGERDFAVAPEPGLITLTSNLTAIVIDAPFGRCEADGLDRIADVAAYARGNVRTTASRGFAAAFDHSDAARSALADLAAAGFITDPTDPRRAVAACPGAPACASGSTPVPDHATDLAKAFAPFAARGLTAHVSGCAKGCAHPRKASLTLVAEDGRYRVLMDAAPEDGAHAPSLTFEEALDRVRRADPARSLAGLFRS